VTTAGAVWCWGYNATGQLGNGSFTNASVPVQVLDTTGTAPLAGVIAIAAGQSHTCAVTDAGATLCWGDNAEGELGNGTENSSSIPVPVSGLSSGVAGISAGSRFTCAVTTAGTALCWGKGDSGQLGNGNATDSATPTAVLDPNGSAPLSGVVTISAGVDHTCAVTSGGTVFCWGSNSANQLGGGTVSDLSYSPLEVSDSVETEPLSGVAAIAASQDHTCAVTTAGATLCWGGANADGDLGNGGSSNVTTATPVSGLSSGVTAIAAGSEHSCAVTSGGAVWCWGDNAVGQLGDGSTRNSAGPVLASGAGNKGFLKLF